MAATVCGPISQLPISAWSVSSGKRCMDIACALAGLVVLAPFALVIAAAILLTCGRPIFFRQSRLGRDGNEFNLLKFRTMSLCAAATGPGVTRSGDCRVTGLGRWLRKWKLDELPQLLNVLKGEMTLVGPRPDLKAFWDLASERDKAALALTPGITGAASLEYCDEESLLASVAPHELTRYYVCVLLPRKAHLDMEYAQRATFRSDCRILANTLLFPVARMASWRVGVK
jgi:lipopolysaccharide/colanic/teichoic acid biosynthesis glycosyltransferase